MQLFVLSLGGAENDGLQNNNRWQCRTWQNIVHFRPLRRFPLNSLINLFSPQPLTGYKFLPNAVSSLVKTFMRLFIIFFKFNEKKIICQ